MGRGKMFGVSRLSKHMRYNACGRKAPHPSVMSYTAVMNHR